MRIAFATLGCRLNQFETDALERAARDRGHQVVDSPGDAEVYVLNSCTITHRADADARQLIRRVARQARAPRIIVTGCYANSAPDEIAAIPGVTAVVGNADKPDLLSHLGGTSDDGPDVCVSALARRMPFANLKPAVDPRRSRALLKVQDGCDYRCSFCIVPQVRGGSRSLPVDRVVAQLDELVAAGVPEVVVTGIHLGTYGRDLRPRRTLSDLVTALVPRLGEARVRISSLDPHEVDDELVELMRAEGSRICGHLHLPVQSGDEAVLRGMRRAHSAEDFRALVERLAREVPGISIGTDVIVGFPGETDAAFERTLALLSGVPLAYLHVFAYSPRANTPAAERSDQVPPERRSARSRALKALSERKSRAFREQHVGHVRPAVVFKRRDRHSGRLVALTDNYIRLELDGDDELCGRQVEVRLGASGTGVIVP